MMGLIENFGGFGGWIIGVVNVKRNGWGKGWNKWVMMK